MHNQNPLSKKLLSLDPNSMNCIMKKNLILLLCPVFFIACNPNKKESKKNPVRETWIQLFNGKDLQGWTPKITGYPVGENFGNTFRVEDGILKVSYDAYQDGFQSRFGHLYTKESFSHYKLRTEYRFCGEQVSEDPGWAYMNNGIMFHSQSVESMIIDQFFPVSVEAQLLGNGNPDSYRTTGNVCTPGTTVWIENELYPNHCASSDSKSYPGNEWVTFEMEVYGDSLVRHIVNGDTVLVYTNLTVDKAGMDNTSQKDIFDAIPVPVGPLKVGHIAIQAESHPTEFRKIELLDLSADFKFSRL